MKNDNYKMIRLMLLLVLFGVFNIATGQGIDYSLVANKDSVFHEIIRKVEMKGGIYEGRIVYWVTINPTTGRITDIKLYKCAGVSQAQYEITTREVLYLNMNGQCKLNKTCRLILPATFKCPSD